ncbi:formate dehydrogenase accessory sulfurtransferase FdhD [Chloroflexota bacterium]
MGGDVQPSVASISAPTHLAVSLARSLEITLIGFVSGRRMNIYSGEWRIK